MGQNNGHGRRVSAGGDGGGTRLRVRMYRSGFGDCFLLTFDPDTDRASHVLIDFGTIGTGSGAKPDAILKDILETTGRRLRAVVATHEHEDHLSGFRKLAKERLEVGEVWAAWTEDAEDPDARKLERYRGDLFAAAAAAGRRLERASGTGVAELARGVREVMAFNGLAEGEPLAAVGGLKERINEAMDAALGLVPRERRVFCSPGEVMQPSWTTGVRVYVLGPPRDPVALRTMGAHGSPDLYELAAAAGVEVAATAGEDSELRLPFDARFMLAEGDAALGGIGASYAVESWRTIEQDGLAGAADLALQLDNATNNTSLVLAFEVDGRVLLFPGDAQLGSWLSWQDVAFTVRDGAATRRVTAEELLGRTVFYKVGHHASHNATATAKGLELMGDAGLTAFIPVDAEVATSKGWTMPAPKLYARLEEKTHGRVSRSDVAVDPKELYVDFSLPAVEARVEPPARPPPVSPRPRRAGAGAGSGVAAADQEHLTRRRAGGKARDSRRSH